MNKKIIKIIGGLALSAVLFTGCATAPQGALIKIGKKYITESEINKEYKKISESFTDEQKKQYDEKTDAGKKAALALKQNILQTKSNNMVIKAKLDSLLAQAKKEGKKDKELEAYIVSDEEVNDRISKIKERIGGEDKFKEELKKYKLTEEDLKIQIKEQEYNQKFEAWFQKAFAPKDDEIEKSYKGSQFEGPEIEASHILVKTEEEAKKIKERLEKGEKIQDIAKDVSEDPSSQTNNGKLGKFVKGVMVPEFYDAASKLKVGEISNPVKTNYGFHIIQLDAIETDYSKFSEKGKNDIKNRLKETILRAKFAPEFEKIKKEIGVLPIKSFK